MTRSLLATIVTLSIAYGIMGCAAVKEQARDLGADLKEAGVALYEDVKTEVKKEVEARLPELKEAALDIVTKALERQAAELKAKELAKLDAQLATLPPEIKTDELTGTETEIIRKALDFDGADGSTKDGDINEKELAALGKWYGLRLAALAAEGVLDAGQVKQHATGTGITMAGILAIIMARKNGRKALANLLRSGGGSATAGVAG
jgi:hypothetical protein